MVICRNCGLAMGGASRIYRDGAIFDRCFRCGYEQPTAPTIVTHAVDWEKIHLKGGTPKEQDVLLWVHQLLVTNPEVLAFTESNGGNLEFLKSINVGVDEDLNDDASAAFVNKKPWIYINTKRFSGRIWDKFKGTLYHELQHLLEQVSLHGKKGFETGDKYYEDPIEFSADVSSTRRLLSEGVPEDKIMEQMHGSKARKEQVMDLAKQTDPGTVISQKMAMEVKYASVWDVIKSGLSAIAPAIAVAGVWDLAVAYETFKKVMENTLAAQTRKSLDPMYAMQKEASPDFKPVDGPESDEAMLVSFAALLDLMRTVIPACVKYSIDTGNDKPLRGVGKLVGVMRQFASENRNAIKRFPGDYDFVETSHSYAPSQTASKGIWS